MRVHDGPVYYSRCVAIAANGFARVAWQESAGNINSLWTAHYDPPPAGWAGSAMVRMGSDSDERYPKLSIDAAGAGLLGWVQDDDMGQDSVWGVSFNGATLGTPQVLDNYTTDSASEVDVAIAAVGGKGLAVWQQRNGSSSADLYAADWVAGEGWKPPARVLNAAWVSSRPWSWIGGHRHPGLHPADHRVQVERHRHAPARRRRLGRRRAPGDRQPAVAAPSDPSPIWGWTLPATCTPSGAARPAPPPTSPT